MKLDFSNTESPTKENFLELEKAFRESPILSGRWVLIDKTLDIGLNRIPHRLGSKPLDVILLREEGGTVAFNYTAFTETEVIVTVTALKTRVRFLLGKAV